MHKNMRLLTRLTFKLVLKWDYCRSEVLTFMHFPPRGYWFSMPEAMKWGLSKPGLP